MKNQEFYIPHPAKAMRAEIESLKLHNQSLTTLCAEANELAQARWDAAQKLAVMNTTLALVLGECFNTLKSSHNKMSEECIVYFEQDGKPIGISTNLGEAYQESEMFEANLKALTHAAELLKNQS